MTRKEREDLCRFTWIALGVIIDTGEKDDKTLRKNARSAMRKLRKAKR